MILAGRGATIVLACRDVAKGARAADRIRDEARQADLRVVRLELASLPSGREAAGESRPAYPRLALLIDNAGVMGVPFQLTEDGFELTLATNHLGPFAFTGLLLDRLLTSAGSSAPHDRTRPGRRGAGSCRWRSSRRGPSPPLCRHAATEPRRAGRSSP